MAERRLRSLPDRRSISERTAKSLHMQAESLDVYPSARTRASRSGSRRSLALSGYLGSHVEQAQQSEEEENGSVTSSGAPFEGFRVNSELHDAYMSYAHDSSRTVHSVDAALAPGSPEYLDARPFFTPSPPPLLPPTLPPPSRSSTLVGQPSSPASTLTRQNSVRHPIRSRTVDFNEFTHRRRSTTRQNAGHSEEQEGTWSESSRDGIWRFRLRDEPPLMDESSTSTIPPSGGQSVARRFFPLSPWSHSHRRPEVGGAFPWNPHMAESSRAGSNPAEPSSSTSVSGQSSSQLWYSLTAAAPTAPDSAAPSPPRMMGTPDNHDEGRPRLRRGGIRPPESLLSRYASPISDEAHSLSAELPAEGTSDATPTEGGSAASHSEGVRSYGVAVPEADNWYHRSSTLQLPTPRSVSPVVESQENIL